MSKVRVGDALRRVEDARFLTGQGRFVDDLKFPDTACAYVVRSPHAHALIRRIDKSAAMAAPGVLAILTGEDVAHDGLGALPCRYFPPPSEATVSACPEHPILVTDVVRHVGDRVALVLAETLDQAKDAGECLEIDYEILPAVATLASAFASDAARIWNDVPGNLCFTIDRGERGPVERAFAAAAHVTRVRFHYPRVSANPIEPRAALAVFDRFDRRYTLYVATQAPYRLREIIASAILHIPETDLRVIAPDVGGGFGMKNTIYPEEALVLWAAGKVGRPVKWTAERSESLASDMHGRDFVGDGEMAFAADGAIMAMRVSLTANLGAYLSYSAGAPAMNAATTLTGVYDLPLVHVTVRGAFTNTAPIGPYRGAGRPEATFLLERLIDQAARELGSDPVALRRRNLVSPAAMPYRTPGGHLYDSGEFAHMLDAALAIADWRGFPTRRQESARRGIYRGIGIGMHCEFSGLQSERMEIRVDPGGAVAVHAGTLATGQGHETMYAQMVSDWLGVPLAQVRVLQGDTDRALFGRGSFAERSTIAGGSALRGAADVVIGKGKRLAAWMLEATEVGILFEDGVFRVAGTNRTATLAEVAQRSYVGMGVPPEFGVGLDGVGSYAGPPSYPNGCIIAEIEVDPETGVVSIVSISAVDDAGVVINPLMLEGQLHGSMAQGIGQSLLEEVRYDPASGQLLSGSFLDYAMPRADDIPRIQSDVGLVPATTNPLGVKGGSEAGNIAAPPAVVNALIDALSPLGISDIPLPATPERVWRAIAAAVAEPRPAWAVGQPG